MIAKEKFYTLITRLIQNKNLIAAQSQVDAALDKYPHDFKLLLYASNIYRSLNDYNKSLEFSHLLIDKYSDKNAGYLSGAKSLLLLRRFEEACYVIQKGLEKNSYPFELLKYLRYVKCYLGITELTITKNDVECLRFCLEDLITYSGATGFFEIIQSKRSHRVKKHISSKNYLFIAGLGRSGTTALGSLMNIFSSVEIYTELYTPFRLDGYSPTCFSEAKLRELAEINPRSNVILNLFNQKHSCSKVIGDKRPYFEFCAESTFDNMDKESFKTIYMERSLIDICRSAYKRSVNPKDRWSSEKGIEHTVLLFNASCRQILHLHDNRQDVFSRFIFVRYEQIFGSIECALSLIESCDIEYSPVEADQLDHFIQKSRPFLDKEINPLDSVEIYIKDVIFRLLDRDVYERFANVTDIKRDYFK